MIVSGFKTSPLESDKIDSGEANPIEILLNFSNHQLGKIENDDEVLMMIKTRTTRIPELTEYVKTNHPYDVAEVITTSIEQGNQPYLDWLGKIVPEKSTT